MSEAAMLAGLPNAAFGLVLVLCRVGSAVMMLPGFGESEIPPMPRLGIAGALAALMLPVLLPSMPALPDGVGALAALVVAEIATGLWLGWLARLPALALPVAGQIVSYLLGLSSVLIPDPTLGGQSTALARLFGVAAPVLVLGTGLHALAIAALAGSYRVVPPGTLLPAGGAANTVIGAVSACFALGLQLAAPFVMAGVAWQVASGLTARLVPRLQIYFVAIPGQILGGLLLFGLLAGAITGAWSDAARDAYARLPGL